MLNKGFRDEEKEKVSEALTEVLDMEFVPDLWKSKQRQKVDGILKKLSGMEISELYEISPDVLLLKLKESNFGSKQYEEFADVLLNISDMEPEHQRDLAQKSLLLYEFSQTESKTFSFGLIQKIEGAKSLI